MKTILLALTVILATATAQARTQIIDMTHRNYVSQSFNLMDDGLEFFDQLAIRLAGDAKEIKIKVSATNPEESACKILKKRSLGGGIILVYINASVDTDSGDACEFEITRPFGKPVTLSIYEEGT